MDILKMIIINTMIDELDIFSIYFRKFNREKNNINNDDTSRDNQIDRIHSITTDKHQHDS